MGEYLNYNKKHSPQSVGGTLINGKRLDKTRLGKDKINGKHRKEGKKSASGRLEYKQNKS